VYFCTSKKKDADTWSTRMSQRGSLPRDAMSMAQIISRRTLPESLPQYWYFCTSKASAFVLANQVLLY
jgi:hypothetical protein